ncbi:DUF3822 family protein [Galbibacter pacificus]|uniref:DUF3822 family protein n=1 Tax=Galbibacter pacificus TaxID=2996052 RepID=A0ABT6FUE1_9FLAO|nr:DUF3822 family protein [Galbibacter pacificus]MDG3583653.1 DUF3822 family protein [Galbibacter pacificus]MDG3586871.1 DUF3822 family protein [Galbibacter pacificus]
MTLKKSSNILDKSFKELSIQVSLSGLSFCIADSALNEIETIDTVSFDKKANAESLLAHLENWFDKDSIKGSSFNKIIAVHENELSSFVPKSLFNESNLSDYLKYNVKILENDYINYDELKEHDMYNVYVPFTNVNNYLFEKFGDFEYKHFSTVLVETLINNAKKSDPKTIYVHIDSMHFEIIVLDQKKLVLYNTFQYLQKEDFIYYLLFTIEQLHLNPEETPTFLLGNVSEESELYKIAYRYIKNLKIGEAYYPPKLNNVIEKLNAPKTLVLLNSL